MFRTLALFGIKHTRKYSKISYIHKIGTEPLLPYTIGQRLEKASLDYGNTEAVIACHQNKSLNYRSLLEEADRLAAGFAKLDFKRGDKIGIWAPNLIEWYVTFMACARGGFILVPINPYYEKAELEYSINKVGVKGLVTPDSNAKKQNFQSILESLCPELGNSQSKLLKNESVPSLRSIITIGGKKLQGAHTYDELLDMADSQTLEAIGKQQKSIKIDDPICIQFTSGTTGRPKAPVMSHFSLVNNGYFIGKRNGFHNKQHILCLQSPLFHAFGSVIGLVSALNFGTTIVLPSERYNPEKNLEALVKCRCTVVYGTPTMFVDLINLQKKKQEKLYLEISMTGGAICSPQLFKYMVSVLKVKAAKSIYGLTEVSGCAFQSLNSDSEYNSTQTIGCLQDHLEAKIINDRKEIVPIGEVGELCLRGYSVMLNYYNDNEKTEMVKEENGWFHTGDLLKFNEDGYAEVVGRLKEMIIRGGENIFPRDIEDLLNTHPDILEAYVVGLPHERLGEEVCACLRTRGNKQLTLEEINNFCSGKLASFKIPSVVKVFNELPKTVTGKVKKNILVNLLKNK